ncbi:WD40 repeat protein [Sphingomonas trueperi]|uniref:WD40 repeat domain-containing protein n=1 Tax=Sphingomonas trueperi TaxID=53317 RepID=UPI00339851E6
MIRHDGPISGVDAHPIGYLATAGYDGTVILWYGGRAIARGHHDHLVNQCQFSARGDRLVTASSDHSARIWAVPTMELQTILRGHDDDVEMATFSPDGKLIATASRDHTVGIFDCAGAMLARLQGHESDVISVAWSDDGAMVVTSSDDGTVRTWNPREHSLVDTVDLGEVEADTAVRAADGTIYVGTDRGTITVLRPGAASELDAHRSGVKRLVLDSEGKMLISTSYDRSLKIWTLRDEALPVLRASAEVPPAIWLRSAALVGDRQLALGTFGGGPALLDLRTGEWDMSRAEPSGALNALCLFDGLLHTVGDAGIVKRVGREIACLGSLCNFLQPFRGRLLTGGHLGTIIDAHSGELVYHHHSPINCATVFRRNGADHIAIGTYTGEAIVMCEGPSGRLERVAEIPLHANAIKGLANNGRDIMSVCATGAVAITPIDALWPARLLEPGHSRISNGVAASPDGWFASVGRDRMLRLWDGERGTAVPTPHQRSIKCVAICPDTNMIATGSYFGVIAVYDRASGRWVAEERPTSWGISSIVALGMGRFCAASYDGRTYELTVAGDRLPGGGATRSSPITACEPV